MEQLTLIQAVRKYLMLPSDGMGEIQRQWKELTDKDKADLREWFPAIGVTIVDRTA